jgi:hypothetical protein
MRDMPVFTGIGAIRNMITKFPSAHVHFGEHESPMHFAARVNLPDFVVLECDGCWMLVEIVGVGVGEAHWFCPDGVKLPALRRIIGYLFDVLRFDELRGATPPGYPNERAARAVSIAVGAVREGRSHVLTRARFLAYNAAKLAR